MQRSRLDNGGATCVCAVLSEARWRGSHRAGRGERVAWTERDRSGTNEREREREREREGIAPWVGQGGRRKSGVIGEERERV